MRRTSLLLTLPILLLSVFAVTLSLGDVLRVPEEFATIQWALNLARDGDEVVVAPGVYSEAVVVPPRAIVLRSESGDPNDTILDGAQYVERIPLVDFEGNTTGTREIRGFTLRGGPGPSVNIYWDADDGHHVVENCRFIDSGPYGTLMAGGASVDVLNNEFIDNVSYLWGAAIAVQGNSRIIGNVFRNNRALPYQGIELTQGGAIFMLGVVDRRGAMVEISDNIFEGNDCTDYGGAIYVNHIFHAVVTGNTFVGNSAGACAGAIYVANNTRYSVSIENNLFVDNESPRGASIGIDECSGTIARFNTIVGSRGGGGIRVQRSGAVTVVGNIVAFGETHGIVWTNSTGVMQCNDAYGNPSGDFFGRPPGETNLSLDPVFCGEHLQNYNLAADSPCLPENNACAILIGAFAQGCAALPVTLTTWGQLKHIYGNGD